MILYLIRHGQSRGNLLGKKLLIIKGRKDNTGLTKQGKKQILKISLEFKKNNIKIERIFTSPLKRAKQSALIFKKFYHKTPLIIDENLIEIDFGEFEGKSWDEIKNNFSFWIKNYLQDRINTPFPSGESRKNLIKRVSIFLKNVEKNKYKTIIIFTHEEVIRAFLSLVTKDSFYFFDRKNIPYIKNGLINSIYLDKNLKFVFQLNDNVPVFLPDENLKDIILFLKKEKIHPLFAKKEPSFSDNLVLRLITKENKKYILKIIPLYKEKEIKKEIFLSNYFKKINLPVPENLKVETKKSFILYLRQFVDKKLGTKFLKDKKYKKIFAYFMGTTLKKIHKISINLKKEKKFSSFGLIYDQISWKKVFLKNWLKNDIDTLKEIKFKKISIIKEIFNNFLKKNFLIKEGLIFYDFHPANFTAELINKKFILTSIWDFENSFWGDTRFDLAYTIKLSFFKNRTLLSQFLKGYYHSNKISQKEKQIIFFYLLIICTGSITYKKRKKINYSQEIENLNYFLKHYLKKLNFF